MGGWAWVGGRVFFRVYVPRSFSTSLWVPAQRTAAAATTPFIAACVELIEWVGEQMERARVSFARLHSCMNGKLGGWVGGWKSETYVPSARPCTRPRRGEI